MTGRADAADPLDAGAARATADKVARRVLAEQNEQHRARDPAFDLRLEDYATETVDIHLSEGLAWEVRYRYANPTVPFVLPTGHPMHFAVRVGPSPDRVDLVPGE